MRRPLMSAVLATTLFAVTARAQQSITAVIDAGSKSAVIRPEIYGMFIEHAGNMLEQGFRAELLEDRKFFFAIGQQPPAKFRVGRRGAMRR